MLHKRKEKSNNPKIVRVEAFDGDCFGITLESGHTILLELESRVHEPVFAEIIKNGTFNKPQTDGERLYWRDGPSISLTEILEMVMYAN